MLKSVLLESFFFSPWVSFYYVRLELTAFHIFRSIPKAACSCFGDQIARQEIRKQQEQRKAGWTGLKCFFGIAVKGFVRNFRWRIITVMELNMSFINQAGFFPFLYSKEHGRCVFCIFLTKDIKKICYCWG